MTNWRRNTALAGPHILEKCCHDLDLINWFCGSHAAKVASFGGRDFFIPENEYLRGGKYPADVFTGWRDPHAVANAFTSDKDLMDNQVSIFQYRNRIRVQFQCTMSNVLSLLIEKAVVWEDKLEIEFKTDGVKSLMEGLRNG